MEQMSGFDVFPVEMNAQGELARAGQAQALKDAVGAPGGPKDLLVLIHGWNNDMAQARKLYEELLGHMQPLFDDERRAGVVVAGILWPSKTFAEEEQIPGRSDGGAATARAAGRATDAALRERLRDLGETLDRADEARLAEAESLIGDLEDSKRARKRFLELLREMLPPPSDDEVDGASVFGTADAERIFARLEPPLRSLRPRQEEGGETAGGISRMDDDEEGPRGDEGSAAGLDGLLKGMRGAAWRLMNLATYYQMKERSRHVGQGLNALLAELRDARPDLGIHLVGHSFGARAATAAVDGPRPFRPSSLVLLQGAFSHHGLTRRFDGTNDGVFAKVVTEGKVNGPIAITHSLRDLAVGKAYALASRMAGDDRSGVGGPGDRFGGIGSNGAVRLPQDKVVMDRLRPAGTAFTLAKGKVTNLRADLPVDGGDPLIKGHSDVKSPATAALIRAAIG